MYNKKGFYNLFPHFILFLCGLAIGILSTIIYISILLNKYHVEVSIYIPPENKIHMPGYKENIPA
jgi:hypothetical protein